MSIQTRKNETQKIDTDFAAATTVSTCELKNIKKNITWKWKAQVGHGSTAEKTLKIKNKTFKEYNHREFLL